MRMVSTSNHAEVTGRSWISAHVMRPVNPNPPTVARKSSAFASGEQTVREPSERSSSKRRRWCPNEPAT